MILEADLQSLPLGKMELYILFCYELGYLSLSLSLSLFLGGGGYLSHIKMRETKSILTDGSRHSFCDFEMLGNLSSD